MFKTFNRVAVVFCALFLVPTDSHAFNFTNSIKFWAKLATNQIEPPLVKVVFSPQQPKQGDVINAFISVETKPENVGKIRAYLSAKLDGQDITLSHPATTNPTEELWVARLGSFPISTRSLDVTTLIEDLNESNEIRTQISDLNQNIASLQIQIQNEVDPVVKAALQTEQNQKIAERVSLDQTLLELRRPIGDDHFSVQVLENSSSSSYPHIVQVSPAFAVFNSSQVLTITGNGFTSQSTVYLGGIQMTNVTFINATTLQAIAPANTSAGLKDVEVRVPVSGGYQNALSRNAFLAVLGSAPSGLSYALNPAIYTKGFPIQANTPELASGMATSFSISPALPTGLSFDALSGAISGTPTAIKALTNFTVTATNHLGSTQTVLSLAVNDQLPSSFSYAQNFAVYTKGVAITANTPIGGSNITSYSVTPALPSGLFLNPSLGMITGTPTTLSGWNEFVITGSNSSGSVTTSISIIVNDQAPVGLSYASSSLSYVKGLAIAPINPSQTGGGDVLSYKVVPALPAGLVLNSETGMISGIPAVLSGVQSYQVTAKNTGGVATTAISISVSDTSTLAIGAINFPDILYGNSTSPQSVSVTNAGSLPATIFTISLTSGTQFAFGAGGTCVVNQVLAPGSSCILDLIFTPSAIGEKDDYLNISYQNGSANVSTSRKLVGVGVDVPPSDLAYPVSQLSLVKNIAITPLSPTVNGGPVVKFSVLPALPAGLTLNQSTGIISGAPTVAILAQDYVIVAANSGGVAFTRINISVVDGVPSDISYQNTTVVYTKGVLISPNVPINTSGMPIVYSVNPTLPSGLSLDSNTGIISGTPVQISSSQVFTVSASNAGTTVNIAINMTVNDQAPMNLTYTPGTSTYLKGTAILPNVPSNSGGAVISYSISPALPTGLSLNTASGVISGTPTIASDTKLYTVTSTNTGGSAMTSFFISVTDTPPTSLIYSANPAVYTKGIAITGNTPTNSGGVITGYIVFPTLPAGLAFNPLTGAITGTPTAITSVGVYTITGSNSGGSISVDVMITVNDKAPTNLVYSTNPATYTKGVQISANTPNSQGGVVTNYSISPVLPAGLTFDTTLGMISGTPTVLKVGSIYTVTASNTGGSTYANVFITVNDVPPSQLTYDTNPAVYEKGASITPNSPTVLGGPVVSYSASPTLPAGLSLNTISGVISGNPSVVVAPTNFTITATNSGGSTAKVLNITVNDVAPNTLTYFTNPVVYTKGTVITPNTPNNSGGLITQYTSLPTLPSGLSLNSSTGVITGTPSVVVSPATNYVITGANSGGSTQVTLSITINDAAPTALTYQILSASYNKDTVIANNNPSNSGGAITNYSVVPALPTGLSLNSTTGVISGTPTDITPSAQYEVTGANISGSTSVMLTIVVNDTSPSNLSYQSENEIYTKGQAILSNSPSISGGAVTIFYSTPALPLGININPNTGVISGYPLKSVVQTSYMITAANAGGSTTKTIQITVNDQTSGVIAIATADKNSCAIYNGALYCWGDNEFSQLGLTFTTAAFVYAPERTPLTSGVTAVAVSRHHTCAIQNGALKCWGLNNKGQLGNNTITQTAVPQSVFSPLDTGVLSVTVGPEYTCAVKTDSSVYCFGNLGSTIPQQKTPLLAISSGGQMMSSGWFYNCGVVNGGVQCSGSNTVGQLGNNSTTSTSSTISYSDVFGMTSGASSVAASVLHTCAIQNGALKCWGDNTFGELGDGSTTSSLVPVQVSGMASKVAFVSAAGCTTNTVGINQNMCATSGGPDADHTCLIIDGVLKCFGDNGYGELGNGTNTDSGTPVQTSGLSSVTTVAVAARHVCAINAGDLKCWGSNVYGQLGNSTTAASNLPVSIPIVNPTPSAFNYTAPTVTYNVGTTIAPNMPSLTGGTFSYYRITGTLPAGLKFDSGSGTIYGTPTATKVATNYTITGYGSNGETSTKVLNITVAAALALAPSISYNPNSYTFYNGLAIVAIAVTNSGGAITSCSASPTLPTGLTLSATCGITGTPTQTVNPGASYTITGTNSSSSNAATIQITVK